MMINIELCHGEIYVYSFLYSYVQGTYIYIPRYIHYTTLVYSYYTKIFCMQDVQIQLDKSQIYF